MTPGAAIECGRQPSWHGIALCGLAATCEGIDAQAMALVATTVMREWHVGPGKFGLVLGAAPLGMVFGALIMGAAADRWGRKPAIIASLGCVGLFTAAVALATSVNQIGLLRLAAGFGMGGVVANVVTLAAELSRTERRARNVTFVFSSVPLGAMIAALSAVLLLEILGWRRLFALWSSIPLLLSVALLRYLPESPVLIPPKTKRPPPVESQVLLLISDGRALGTLFVWLGLFIAFQVTYFFSLWLPTLLENNGFPIRTAIATLIALNAGATIGAVVLGAVMQRIPAQVVVPVCYVLAAAAAGCAAGASSNTTWAAITTFLLGLLTLGGQVSTAALVALLYPAHIRGIAIGWTTGIGRLGAVSGPALGGILLGAGWRSAELFQVVAVAELGVATLLWLGAHRLVQRARMSAAAPPVTDP